VKVCAHHGGEETNPDALDRTLRPDDEARVRAYLRAHLPSLDAPPLRSRVCMYTNTPDEHFLVGAHPRWPHVVVLGGGFGVAAFDQLRGPAEEIARREALEPMRDAFRLAKAELGTAAGLIGAAFVGFEALDSSG